MTDLGHGPVTSKDAARLRENDIGQSGSEGGEDLGTKLLVLHQLHAVINKGQISLSVVQAFVPGCVYGSSKECAPTRIQPTPAPGDVRIPKHHQLRPRLGRLEAHKITDVGVSLERGPVRGTELGLVRWTEEDQRRTQFIGANAKMIGPVLLIKAAAVRDGELPGQLVSIIAGPESQAQARFFLIVDAGDPLSFSLAAGQSRQKKYRQDRDDRNDNQ